MSQIISTIIFVVIGAALCACLEAAFFTVSLGRARLLKEQGKRGGTALLAVKEQIHQSIIMLVILNNAVTIAGAIYVGHLATEMYGKNYSKSISLTFAPIVFFLTKIFRPITFVIEFMTQKLIKKHRVVSEDELKVLSEIGEAEGSIEHDEKELIKRVFTLNDLTARDIMTPRTVIEALPAGATAREVAVEITHKPYSRYPVFQDSIDTVVGVVQSSKLLAALARDNDNELVSYFMTTPVFVSERKRVDDLLSLFLATRNHLAIVQDEFGTTTGLVTFEDVLEQLVGEIMDETDEVVDLRSFARDKHSAEQK